MKNKLILVSIFMGATLAMTLPASATTRPYREVKYVAGPDNKWFTNDDSIYHYFTYDFDKDGKILKKMCFKIGPDNLPFTSDDELQDYQIFEYDTSGKVTIEKSYDGKNNMQYTAVYDYDKDGKKIKVVRTNPVGEIIRYITFEYDPANKLIKDAEYVNPGEKIEKYHRFEYDNKNRLVRVMEYHADHQGPGPDGKWFTGDDVVSSTKMYFYNKDDTLNTEKKFIGAGPDGKWFSDDDVLQYYVLYYYK